MTKEEVKAIIVEMIRDKEIQFAVLQGEVYVKLDTQTSDGWVMEDLNVDFTNN